MHTEASEEAKTAKTLILDFYTLELWENKFLFKSVVFGYETL